MPQMLMQHDTDPAELIRKNVGDLKDITLFGHQVLLGVYERPKQTKSGIYLADQTRSEDRFQGKAGLVLAMGKQAFSDYADLEFKGEHVEVGDWVAIFISDGRPIVINKQLCRLVEDQYIRLKIPAPDIIF